MALMIIAPDTKVTSWVKHLSQLAPEIDIRIWPDTGNVDEIDFALSWNHPPGEFRKYKHLKCIASLGAGVDHLLSDPDLPAGVPITRVVEHSMARSMSEYVVLAVLNHCRQFDVYRTDQSQKNWQPRIPLLSANMRIGIMGLGQLGKDAARKLSALGFAVSGWSKTPKTIVGADCFAGAEALDDFLPRTRILICMLPLTPQTKGILNQHTFDRLPAGAYVINVARGAHLIEDDLLAALDADQLSGACLDVFETEPLPSDHPFWDHPKIKVTPHISSITFPRAVAPQIIDNYRRSLAGQPLLHVVDPKRCY
ncbi:MAG: glyoxylate/hydroxypyruvate reductase A [Desulfobacterales bacterium]|jgi:glyoxylate/hydroxypyruvate reductase A